MPVLPVSNPSLVPDGWGIDVGTCSTWGGLSAAQQAYASSLAVFSLFALTGRQFGTAQVTVRPCNQTDLPPLYQVYPVNLINPWGTDEGNTYYPLYINNGVWHNTGCRGINCCGANCEVLLPAPVASITTVTVDGAAVDPTAYRVDGRAVLVRTDGACWPQCQDANKNSGANTFFVTYARGRLVPKECVLAAGVLACEIAKAITNQPCRLPQRMQSMTRQGVSVQFVTPNTYLDRGLTNVFEVDQLVAQLNPYRLTQRPQVLSLDQSPSRMTTS